MDQGNYLECPMTGTDACSLHYSLDWGTRLNLKIENWRALWYRPHVDGGRAWKMLPFSLSKGKGQGGFFWIRKREVLCQSLPLPLSRYAFGTSNVRYQVEIHRKRPKVPCQVTRQFPCRPSDLQISNAMQWGSQVAGDGHLYLPPGYLFPVLLWICFLLQARSMNPGLFFFARGAIICLALKFHELCSSLFFFLGQGYKCLHDDFLRKEEEAHSKF